MDFEHNLLFNMKQALNKWYDYFKIYLPCSILQALSPEVPPQSEGVADKLFCLAQA